MYLFKDGYDKLIDIKQQKMILDMENKIVDYSALWKNKINGKPDSIEVMDRNYDQMKNHDEEFVNKHFGPFYKNMRDNMIKRHVAISAQVDA